MQSEALTLGCDAARIARSRGVIELALGEALARLFDQDGLSKLGYSGRIDYARERLGVPPRTMFEWVRLARALSDRPLLRRAVTTGMMSPRAALTVAPLAIDSQDQPRGEAVWVAAAMQLPLAELKRAVRAEGVNAEPGYGNVESLILRMTPAEQDRLDEAIRMAQEQSGFAAPRWQCVEIVCQEWLGQFGWWGCLPECQPESESADSGLSIDSVRTCQVTDASAAVIDQLRAIDIASTEPLESETPDELEARLMRLMEARRGFDTAFGEIAARVVSTRAWKACGFRCLEEYCREHLGVSARSFRERVWLEKRMSALPELRAALQSGELTYSKALLVAKDACASDVEERIEEATATTCQQIERESTQDEDRRNRALGIRRLWGPEDAARTIAGAIASACAVAEASGLGKLDAGAALALIATHFIKVWKDHARRAPAPRRREVLMRHGGLCAVPGCSRSAQHEHHITYRSRGGSDETSNLLGLCVIHHLRGVHPGNLTVVGRSGDLLEWRFGNGEEWVTRGNDDVSVRRRPPARGAPSAGDQKGASRRNHAGQQHEEQREEHSQPHSQERDDEST